MRAAIYFFSLMDCNWSIRDSQNQAQSKLNLKSFDQIRIIMAFSKIVLPLVHLTLVFLNKPSVFTMTMKSD
jgi:hypothetical protein